MILMIRTKSTPQGDCPLCAVGIPVYKTVMYDLVIRQKRKSKGWRRRVRKIKAKAREPS